jgi:DNA-binding beta-propeller fold protein YncE
MLRRHATVAFMLALSAPAVARAQLADANFLYKLSTMTGTIRSNGVSVSFDPGTKETILFGDGRVRIFNPSGMEIFSFGDDPDLGAIVAAASTEEGDFILLSYFETQPALIRANFRGEPKKKIDITGLPEEIPQPFRPNGMGYGKQRVYLIDLAAMRLVVVDPGGKFLAFHDLAKICEVEDKRVDNGVKGFRVAPNGDFLFTVQPLFKAYVLAPDGTFRAFGTKGSAPGKFNIVTGIAVDERGNYYVADILKSAVLIFDKNFRWLKEFGYRGNKPSNIIAPVDLAVGDGKLYVSQFARKGVSVFEIKFPEAP